MDSGSLAPALFRADQMVWLQVEYYKRRLLYVTAGLDRGFAANPNASSEVESAVTSLVSATDPVVLSWTSGESLCPCTTCSVQIDSG